MKRRMKKILILNVIVCLFLFNICNVLSYDYVKEDNEGRVQLKKKEIYQLKEMYDYLLDNQNNYDLLNYSGVCSTVTIEGDFAGTYTLEEYVAGVVKSEIGATYVEAQKAQAVAARSYLIGQKANSTTCTVPNGEGFQTFKGVDRNNPADAQFFEAAEATAGIVIMRNGEIMITYYSSSPPMPRNNVEKDGKWHVTLQKDWTAATEWTWIGPSKSVVCSTSKVYCGSDGAGHNAGMSQILAMYLASQGQDYEKILETFYGVSGYTLGTLSDGNYVGDLQFVDSDFGKIWYYNQGDYKDYYYSTNVNSAQYGSATIASHGCGPTSLAIVFSSFENREVTPITTTQDLCKMDGCTSGGSYFGVMETMAKNRGYKTQLVNKKDASKVTAALATGNSLVIALMGPGTFTKGGHYIVLTGTRSDGTVSVADPASRSRTEKKWFSFNLVIEQSKSPAFLIISK